MLYFPGADVKRRDLLRKLVLLRRKKMRVFTMISSLKFKFKVILPPRPRRDQAKDCLETASVSVKSCPDIYLPSLPHLKSKVGQLFPPTPPLPSTAAPTPGQPLHLFNSPSTPGAITCHLSFISKWEIASNWHSEWRAIWVPAFTSSEGKIPKDCPLLRTVEQIRGTWKIINRNSLFITWPNRLDYPY